MNTACEIKTGFRTEQFRGSGIRDLKKILEFEIIELENADILDYVYTNMIQNDNNVYEEDIMRFMEELPSILYILHSQPGIEFKYDMNDIVDKLYKYLCCKDNKNLQYGLWLCDSYEDCYNQYMIDDGIRAIDSYKIDKAIYKISDLGNEGSLYCFETLPELFCTTFST